MNEAGRIIVALDTDSFEKAEKWVRLLGDIVSHFKIGCQLFTACGPKVIDMVHQAGAKVFLDLKYHDIPNTVRGSVQKAQALGVWMLNVHALGGKKMMQAAVEAIANEVENSRPILLAVTVLTSLDDKNMAEVGLRGNVLDQVRALARLAKEAGLQGVVASAKEAAMIKKELGQDFLVVTPGVRPAWSVSNEQVRFVTPREALLSGADYLIIGRPITGEADPRAACERLVGEISNIRG